MSRTAHARRLEALVHERVEALKETLVTINYDEAGYRHVVGQIIGLRDALQLSQQADMELSGDLPNGRA